MTAHASGPQRQTVRVVTNGPIGNNARVYIDGIQRDDVTEVQISLKVGHTNTATVTFVCVEVDATAELDDAEESGCEHSCVCDTCCPPLANDERSSS